MLKMIRPIVNISKIADDFDTVVVGFRGVIADGKNVKQEAIQALINLKKAGKKIIMLTNSPQRVGEIANFLLAHEVPLQIFDGIVSAGEIMHYKLKSKSGNYAAIGQSYFSLGKETGPLRNLDYIAVDNIARADFIYANSVDSFEDSMNKYLPLLEHAASLSIPFVCVGTEKSTYLDGEVALAPGSLAEQYALLGGKIISLGKPDPGIFAYALDNFQDLEKDKVLVIGDNITTDIKGADLHGLSSVLISKGIHVNLLGEGYIPDVAKTRELADNFGITPNFVISQLRW